jgi:hypothetical protein
LLDPQKVKAFTAVGCCTIGPPPAALFDRRFQLHEAGRRHADHGLDKLRGANLSHANLSGADLSYANLGHANLTHADLSESDISYADLRHADLSHANLSCARLNGANLGYANLSGVSGPNLRWAYLAVVRPEEADSKGSDLHPTDGAARTTASGTATSPTKGADLHPASETAVNTAREWTRVYRTASSCGYPDDSLDVGGEGG